eukprot:TRINITY_DN4843_c0_g1_i1.p1 TRINITY_DN4843_c0_g1~~TRINITY_DN4843_c0_g1_i1.p1  ORF type:complete len:842 (+),score=101.95 TRINITY_DN4843_c0_g1_i1:689-3214(+)
MLCSLMLPAATRHLGGGGTKLRRPEPTKLRSTKQASPGSIRSLATSTPVLQDPKKGGRTAALDLSQWASWDTQDLLRWARQLRTAKGAPLFSRADLQVLKANRLLGSHLRTLTIANLTSNGLPLGPAESLLTAVQNLKCNSVAEFVTEIMETAKKHHFPKQQPVKQYGFVDRPGFNAAALRVIERNLLAFEKGLQHPNDYAYAVFAGGSGMGKTAGGFELAQRIRKFCPNYHVVHAFMLPGASPFHSQLQEPVQSRNTNLRPSGEVDPNKDPVALGLAAWHFFNNSSPEAQYELLSLDSRCSNLTRVVDAIRVADRVDVEQPLLIVLQLDEFQDAWYTSLLMLRSIRTWIRGNMVSKKCLIIPVLSGTSPASLTSIESLTSTGNYGSEIFSMAPLTLDRSATLAHRYAGLLTKSGLSKPSFDFEKRYETNQLYRHILSLIGGVPKIVEILVDILMSDSASSKLESVDHAMHVLENLCHAMSHRYHLARILGGLGGGSHGLACLRQIAALSYFRDECNRDSKLNGSTIGDMETSGIIFLEPLPPPADLEPTNQPEELFMVKMPLILYFYFASVIPEWSSLFSKQLLRGGMSLSDDTFSELIAHLHRATYTLLTWRRGWNEDPTSTLRLFFNDAAISLGDPSVVDTKFPVSAGVDFRQCPSHVAQDGPQNEITTVKSVAVMDPSKAGRFDSVDVTTRRWIVLTRKRAAEVDALTPHSRGQFKFSGYLSSGLPLCNAHHKQDHTVFITKTLLEEEKLKGVPWKDAAFILISPKNLVNAAGVPVLKQADVDPSAWFGNEKVLVVCGWDAVMKFGRGFLSQLALPKQDPSDSNSKAAENGISGPPL